MHVKGTRSVIGDEPHATSAHRCRATLARAGMSLAAALLLVAIAATSAGAFIIERLSVGTDGLEADSSSTTSAISADGNVVAFVSAASNLVVGDLNFQLDVFVHDRTTGVTERVSVASDGSEAAGQSATPALSADGRFVAFASAAPNLVPGDANGRFDVFVHDRMDGTTELVSVASDGAQGTSDSVAPAISADGRLVAFASAAGNLVPGDGNASFDIFLRDRLAQTTTRVSVGTGGVEANGLSLAPRLSADGAVVVFHSFASNLVPGDTNGVPDVFVHAVAAGTTLRASVASDGTQGTQQSVGSSIAADGRFVAFDSDAPNLVPGDTNGRTDVFVHDLVTGATERVSVSSLGGEGNNRSGFLDPPALSADGRFVAFTSGANNLVPNDTNNVVDVMLYDRATGEIRRVNVTPDGTEADGSSSLWPSVSADARVVVFASMATNLVPGDVNFAQDVFANVDTCGNGLLEAGEQCDDGNSADGDCCSSACELGTAGSACDDGDLCTRSDLCDAGGTCVGADPVVCEDGTGQCGSPAICDPATGECAGGPAPDGSACDDGDSCTVEDTCLDGVCEPGDLVPSACVSSFQCYAGVSWTRPWWWHGGEQVLLEDLFEEETYRLGSTRSVCTALDAPASQLASRLACARLKTPHGGRSKGPDVRVRNALGEHALAVGKARELCLASATPQAPEEVGLDSMKCYSVSSGFRGPRFQATSLTLVDEFGSANVDVLGPEMLCNPASVDGGGVLHEAVHLVCYRIVERWRWGRVDFFRPRTVRVDGYFGEDVVTLLRRELLCVPSLLVEP